MVAAVDRSWSPCHSVLFALPNGASCMDGASRSLSLDNLPSADEVGAGLADARGPPAPLRGFLLNCYQQMGLDDRGILHYADAGDDVPSGTLDGVRHSQQLEILRMCGAALLQLCPLRLRVAWQRAENGYSAPARLANPAVLRVDLAADGGDLLLGFNFIHLCRNRKAL